MINSISGCSPGKAQAMKGVLEHCVRMLVLLSFASALQAGTNSSPQVFTITAKRFSFQPAEITVESGRPVMLQVTSEDVTHGLKCNDLKFNIAVHKGRTTELTFTPHQVGRFVARCSHFCGMGHGSMTFVINVVEK